MKKRTDRPTLWLCAMAGLGISATIATAQPANNDCSAASTSPIPGAGGTVAGTLVGATEDAGSGRSCATFGVGGADVYHAFTPSGTGPWRISLCASDPGLDSVVSIHDISGGCPATAANQVATGCNDDFCSFFGPSQITSIALTNGTPYVIRVSLYDNLTAPDVYSLTVTDLGGILPPANDLCSTASVASVGANPGSNELASSDIFESSCSFEDEFDVWFEFTAPSAGVWIFDTEGSTGLTDTTLSLYGDCGGPELACDDDSGTGFLSRLLRTLANGETVFIRVAGYAGATGDFVLNISGGAPPPSNDECASAIAVLAPSSTAGDNSSATGVAGSCSFNDFPDVWYRFTNTTANPLVYTIDTEGSTGNDDTTLAVFDACVGTELACDDDGGTALLSSLSVIVNAGQQVWVRVSGYDGLQGAFLLNIDGGVTPPAPPANDDCATAIVVGPCLPFSDTQQNFSANNDLDVSCNISTALSAQNGVWYEYTPATSGYLNFSQSGFQDTTTTFFSGGCGALSEVACFDGDFSATSPLLTAGTTYHILVSRWADSAPGLLETITFEALELLPPAPVPSNDTCAGATVVTSLPFTDTVRLAAATDDIDVSCNSATALAAVQGIWYVYTPAVNQSVQIASPDFQDTAITVFSGGCGALAEVACSDPEVQTVALTGGVTYHILVAQWGDTPVTDQGAVYETVIAEDSVAFNDTCAIAEASPITLPFFTVVNSTTAANEPADPAGSCNFAGAVGLDNSIYYAYTPSSSGTLNISVNCGYDSITAVYTGTCAALTEIACADEPQPNEISLAVTAGTTYYIQIGDWGVTGGGINIISIARDCPTDLDGDGLITADDIFFFLNLWFEAGPGSPFCGTADWDGDGVITADDIFAFLNDWFASGPGSSCT